MRLSGLQPIMGLALLLSLAACGSKSDTAVPSPPTSAPVTSANAPGQSIAAVAGDAVNNLTGAVPATESYGDWTVKCIPTAETAKNRADCAVSQQLFDQTSNRRTVAVAVNPVPGGGVKGALVLPLGLALDAGATLQLDAAPAGQTLRFHTCLPTGCLVDLDLPPALVDQFGKAATLHISSSGTDGAIVKFDLPMNGFASALGHAISLSAGP